MGYRGLRLLALALSLGVSHAALAAEQIAGQVVEVIDGDSFVLTDGDARYEVWVQGIDAPDPGMPYSEEAKQALAEMILGKTVRVRVARYGAGDLIEGVVTLGRERVAERMLAEGWAWRYYEYAHRHSFSRAERQARAAGKGLWAGEDPIPPWEYRSDQKRNDLVPSAEALAKEARLVDQIPPQLTLEVEMNRSKLFRAKRRLQRLSVTATEVAEVIQFSPTEFEVIPRRAGETTLTVWFTDPQGADASLRYLIRVNAAK